MIFSQTVTMHRQIALNTLSQATPSRRAIIRPIYTRYLAAVHAAEQVFLEATEAEREAALAAKTSADAMFRAAVTAASEKHEALMESLNATDQVAREEAEANFLEVVRSANNLYDRAVGPTTIVLKALEARVMVSFESAAKRAFDTFRDEVQATVEPTESRSNGHAGSDRFILQEQSGKC